MTTGITRLAPSPTGALHLGNARTFLLNWLLAKQNGWRVLFRMEDLDGPRVKTGADKQAVDELQWLGLQWQGDIVVQSGRAEAYQAALDKLLKAGMAYRCICSRSEIAQSASAPAADDFLIGSKSVKYPGTCRDRFSSDDEAARQSDRPPAWRVRVGDESEPITFCDQFAGCQSFDLAGGSGDFVIFRSHGLAAYQLAVVVDDAEADVDMIVRADDLLESAAMQIHLRRLLGIEGEVKYWHLPLVIGPDGRKLAKRHGDTKISSYIQAGTSVNRMLGLLGYWSGLLAKREETDLDALLADFDIAKLPHEPIVFTPAADAFLLGS